MADDEGGDAGTRDLRWRVDLAPGGDVATAIVVWRFDDAPAELRELMDQGGDEDWLALVPAALAGEDADIRWLERGHGFGGYEVVERVLPDGRKLVVGVH